MEAIAQQKRLDSWKSIALYLGRSCRTAQRWQEEYGMPVRRVGGDTGSVFAYIHELENWLRNRQNILLTGAPECSPVLVPAAPAERSSVSEKPCVCAEVPEAAREESEAQVALARRMWRVLSYGSLGAVAQTFRLAIDQDCTNAAAFAGLSAALIVKSLLGGPGLQDASASARAAMRRALELDPELPEAMCMSGWLKILEERDWESAYRALQVARQERRLTARFLIGVGLLRIAEGKIEEASAFLREASHQSALNTIWAEFNCWGLYLAGDFPLTAKLIVQHRSGGLSGPLLDAVEALVLLQSGQPISKIEKLRGSRVMDHPNPVVLGVLGYAYAVTKQPQKAEELLGQLKAARLPDQNHYAVALILLGLKRNHEAVERLKLSYQGGSLWSLAFRSDPMLRGLRGCNHFCDFIHGANYPVQRDEALLASEEGCPVCIAEKRNDRSEYTPSGLHTARYRSRKVEAGL